MAVRALRPKGHQQPEQPGPGDPLPADFLQQRDPADPTFPTVHKIDAMIAMLLGCRESPRGAVREAVDRMWLAALPQPTAPMLRGDGPIKRRWVMLLALESAWAWTDVDARVARARPVPLPVLLALGALGAFAFIDQHCPGRVSLDLVRPAVKHYRTSGRAKWPALHALADALGCDMPRRRDETSGQYVGEDPLRTTLGKMTKDLRESSKP